MARLAKPSNATLECLLDNGPGVVKRVHMPPITRFRLPLGAVLLGLAASTACGRKDEASAPRLVAPGLAAASTQPSSPDTSGPQGGLPVLHVQADEVVTAGTAGHEATVAGDPGLKYEWFIQGGSFTGDTHGESVAWSAAGPGEVRIFCEGTNEAGKKSVALARVQSEAPPSIENFRAQPPIISEGRATRLGWSAKEIKTLTLDPGGIDVVGAKNTGYEVKPTETMAYTLKATNLAGASVAQTVEVKVVPVPAILSFGAQGAVNFGQPLTLAASFKGGKAEIRQGEAVLASGTSSPLQAQVPSLKSSDSFQLTVTNEAGDSVTRSLTLSQATASQP